MSKIKNGGLNQYGAEPFEQQQFETAGIEGVNNPGVKFVIAIQRNARDRNAEDFTPLDGPECVT